MAKNSFVLYSDYEQHIKLLSNEQAGILLKNIFAYVGDADLVEMDATTAMAFSFIKANLDRDFGRYDEVIEKRREAGKKGGRPAKANAFSEKQTKANAFSEKQTKAKKAVTDTVTDTVTVNDIDIYNVGQPDDTFSEKRKKIVDYLNEKAGTHFSYTTNKTRRCIRARLNEGFTVEDFKKVIDKKVAEWTGTEWQQYLRPETLFGTKFEGYLNSLVSKPKKPSGGNAGAFSNYKQSDIDFDALSKKVFVN